MKKAGDYFYDGVAWAMNIFASVGVIFVNKVLMGSTSSGFHGFQYATTLSGMHFICAAAVMQLMVRLKVIHISNKKPSRSETAWYVLFGASAVVCLNLSLVLNSVGFYQMMKLMVLPFIGLVEATWLKKRFSVQMLACMGLVCGGVGLVTITDVHYKSSLGLVIAIMSVIGSGMQSIYCNRLQSRYSISSIELLLATMWYIGTCTLLAGPFLDYYITGTWVFSFPYSLPVMLLTCASCTLAIFVNLSQFMCLGRFAAVTYATMGHAKTVLVIIGAWLLFSEAITERMALGLLCAIMGMVLYARTSSREPRKSVGGAKLPVVNKQAQGVRESLLNGKVTHR